MKTITVMDPVTRIEGHMKVEITVDGSGGEQQIVDARCTGTLFRGSETILNGRDPLDGPLITQRICGVCPISHGQAAVLALEDVSEWLPPTNARLLRNLTLAANFLQSHILHFYLLAALDYVAGPNTAPWTPAWQIDLRGGLDSVAANLPGAIQARRQAHEMGAVFGGRMPTSNSFIPGGFTAIPTSESIDRFKQHLAVLSAFINSAYLPDVQALATVYADYFSIGAGSRNLMAYGVFEMDDNNNERLFSGGYTEQGATGAPQPFSTNDISESVKYSWYADETANLNPADGKTLPTYPKGDAYSWLKAPRLLGQPFETGPLARMWINNDYQQGISVMDRHLARAQEAAKIAEAMSAWLDQLTPDQPTYDEAFDQHSGIGVGLTEAPRGALGHWVEIREGRISHYQVITPTCWNASPRDDQDVAGPMEQALIGTPIQNPEQPIEALRVIHSFDPCLSCAVHILSPAGKPVIIHAGG
ncbi:MAG: nickel-dependent hydrogenase large subunit [Desulfofustis sp.]|nr:nickel-dependent hydrogenase large subunit [Desulfofustis sp.]